MNQIDLGSAGGGIIPYGPNNELQAYAEIQIKSWDSFIETHQLQRVPNGSLVGQLTLSWRRLAGLSVELSPDQYRQDATNIANNFIAQGALIGFDTPAGLLLRAIPDEISPAATIGPIRAWAEGPVTLDHVQFNGYLYYLLGGMGLTKGSARARERSYDRAVENLAAAAAAYRQALEAETEQAKAAYRDKLNRLESEHATRAADYEALKNERTEDRKRWEQDLAALRDLYLAHMSLKGPVEYWTVQEGAHQRRSKTYRRWALWIGGLGFIGGLAFALTAFAGAGGLLTLLFSLERPDWHLQAAAGGVLTVAYFTFYTWLMRIAARVYMTEHHLAIDAGVRARMAQTYLALINEKGADREDRAIVLASLFRPVADGLVKDDAMPMFSPSAFLSQAVGGR